MSQDLKYRPEIDGLRTLAVIPVILYHLKIPFGGSILVPGGFLGVDVFFVISGYLITRIILGEVRDEGRFRIGRFYQRRARRILPALFLVIAATSLAAPFVLTGSEIHRYAWSLVATLGFVSNFFWYLELGQYGAQSGLLQPMLHTWSLAIEEQFYLLFPLLLMVLRPKGRGAIWAFLAMAAASLVAAHWSSLNYPEFSFFSPASRAWELLAGSALAANAVYGPSRTAPRWLALAGLAAIVASMALVELNAHVHPGLITLPTVLGTVAIIWAADPGEPVGRLLSSAPMVGIGKLSYSLYLWHFPIFALGRLATLDTPGPAHWAAWTALTFAAAWLGYRFVEKPFRFTVAWPRFLAAMLAALAATGGFVAAATQTEWFGKDRNLAALYGVNQPDNEILQTASRSILGSLTPGERFDNRHATRHAREDLWFAPDAPHKVLVVGDSHGKDLFNALYQNRASFPGVSWAHYSIDKIEDTRGQLMQSPNFRAADTIVLARRWYGKFAPKLPGIIAAWRAEGKRVVIVGTTAEFLSPSELPVFDWTLQRTGHPVSAAEMNRTGYVYEDHRLEATRRLMRDIAAKAGAFYLERRDLVCSDPQRACTLMTPDGRKAMFDYGHWTLEGAKYFGSRAVALGWGKVLTGSEPAPGVAAPAPAPSNAPAG